MKKISTIRLYITGISALFVLSLHSNVGASDLHDYLPKLMERVPDGRLGSEQFGVLSKQLEASINEINGDLSTEDSSSIDLLGNAGVLLVSSPFFSEPGNSARRKEAIVAIEMLLRAIDRGIDRSWSFPLPKANVSPPIGVPSAAAGMNPAEIDDRLLREKYEEAIEKNNSVNFKNKQQQRLRVQQEIIIRSISALSGRGEWKKNELIGRFAKTQEEIDLFTKFSD